MRESSLRIAMHEIGHGFGFVDDPAALDTLYSYDVHYDLPQARDIEEIQSVFGPSPRDDVIHGGMWGGTIYEGAGDGLVYGNQGMMCCTAIKGGILYMVVKGMIHYMVDRMMIY